MLLGHHDLKFAKGKTYYYDASTLKNVIGHLADIHKLNEGGDTWRKVAGDVGAQPSAPVDGAYEKVIPFRQLEFKNAFLE